MTQTFLIDNENYLLNNKPFQIISGAIHYFRIHPSKWKDSLKKLKAFGANTVETYVPWSLHERQEGIYDFEGPDGILNLKEFIETAQEEGLLAIIRPGPYICAEMDLGGLPSWLLKDKNMKLRCYYEPYIKPVTSYLKEVFKIIAPYQITQNGPIIMVQVENEYGAYGNDKRYLNYLKNLTEKHIEVPLFTSDQPTPNMLQSGSIEGVHMTANFGSKANEKFSALQKIQKTGPLMCMEFWCGWFDRWGGSHTQRNPKETAAELKEVLQKGSVNIYMFHGGTNFGLINGANKTLKGPYEPTATTYDYDAFLSEAGDITDKFIEGQKIVSEFNDILPLETPDNSFKLPFMETSIETEIPLLQNLESFTKGIDSITPLCMEEVGVDFGFIAYKTEIPPHEEPSSLTIQKVRDKAWIYMNGQLLTTIHRDDEKQVTYLPKHSYPAELIIIIENQGRINYGPNLHDRKGITQGVLINDSYHFNWKIYPLTLDKRPIVQTPFTHKSSTLPYLYKATLHLEEPKDTFIQIPGEEDGILWINNFKVGRYCNQGPQKRLYIPGGVLKKGENTVEIFSMGKLISESIYFHPEQEWSSIQP